MTAPVLNELRRRLPDLRLTVQSDADEGWLRSRFAGPFTLIRGTADFGARMDGPLCVDLDQTAAAYRALHADFDVVIAGEAERLSAQRPDAVLSNVSYVALAAAARAGIPAMAFSCLAWPELYGLLCGDRPEAPRILADMRAAHDSAAMFLRATPGMPLAGLAKVRTVGPVADRRRSRRAELAEALRLRPDERIALIGFGGIDLPLPFADWPRLRGWRWLMPERQEGRDDIVAWTDTGFAFNDLAASADAMVTKPGYATFVECAVNGVPVLYVPRPDWPESPFLEDWFQDNARCMRVDLAELFDPAALEVRLRMLFSLPPKPLVEPTGVAEVAEAVMDMLAATRAHECS